MRTAPLLASSRWISCRAALDGPTGGVGMKHSQYDLVIDRECVRKRLEEPFVR